MTYGPLQVIFPPFFPSAFSMSYSRSAALGITLFGAVSNFAFTIQVLALWRSLKWEPESEWEASGDDWKVDGVKVIWGLVSGYFACAATVCIIGILGILKVNFIASLLRFVRIMFSEQTFILAFLSRLFHRGFLFHDLLHCCRHVCFFPHCRSNRCL